MIVIIQALLCTALVMFGLLLLADYWRSKKIKETLRELGIAKSAIIAMLVSAAIYVGGTKQGTIVIDDYLVNDGSYITNDYVHIAITRATDTIPTSTEILVYARELSSTNSSDWARLSPHLTFADHPYDYTLANATNYNILVIANFSPSPTVHTNGVWQARGFVISSRTNTFGFANSKIKKGE